MARGPSVWHAWASCFPHIKTKIYASQIPILSPMMTPHACGIRSNAKTNLIMSQKFVYSKIWLRICTYRDSASKNCNCAKNIVVLQYFYLLDWSNWAFWWFTCQYILFPKYLKSRAVGIIWDSGISRLFIFLLWEHRGFFVNNVTVLGKVGRLYKTRRGISHIVVYKLFDVIYGRPLSRHFQSFSKKVSYFFKEKLISSIFKARFPIKKI